ncbi:MAG: biotin--protein ligase [Alphaproteobacteria bacterium]|nr:biotin--protein ligase [Alphaproteobacteria bacterium]
MIKCFWTIITLLIFLPTFGANILVYNDNGVDWSSLQWVSIFFKNRGDKVKNVNADFLINNPEWMTQYDKIVIPGGADCPYHEKLKGTGCRNIKKFVENGGTYIGICAGGYFGCKKVEFALGTGLEVNEYRELAFFPGVARGPMLKPYVYDSEDGASAAKVRSLTDGSIFYSYHNGGSTFVLDEINQNGIEVLAEYADENNSPAVIRCKCGKGQAILSGIHFEADQKLLYSTSPTKELDKIKPIAEKVGSTEEIKKRFLEVIL